MAFSSDEWNFLSSDEVPMIYGEGRVRVRHSRTMPRKRPALPSVKDDGHDWFLREWLVTLKLRQADLARKVDMPKATMSAIFNGKTNYYRELVNSFAEALNIHPYELLMHPDDAMAIRRLRVDARQIATVQLAADGQRGWESAPEPLDLGVKSRP